MKMDISGRKHRTGFLKILYIIRQEDGLRHSITSINSEAPGYILMAWWIGLWKMYGKMGYGTGEPRLKIPGDTSDIFPATEITDIIG